MGIVYGDSKINVVVETEGLITLLRVLEAVQRGDVDGSSGDVELAIAFL